MCPTTVARAELQRQWSQKADELRSVDELIQSLRAELQQAERRHVLIAEAEASLRQQLDSPVATPNGVGEEKPGVSEGYQQPRVGVCQGATSADLASQKQVASGAATMFSMDAKEPEGDDLLNMCVDACRDTSKDPAPHNLDDEWGDWTSAPMFTPEKHLVQRSVVREEPMTFSLDDDDCEKPSVPFCSGGSSVQDWETSFEVINQKPSAHDRASVMKHRMALASLKQGASVAAPMPSPRVKALSQEGGTWHRISRTVSLF
jgi:hypothetical protein